ncbi:ATP-dependent 6-phosphofructokinase [Alteromonas oceanisediminis]|uniref:ATP-dependent 6-phosphofructokinase n=1 Tax=Alteromonas oceanisediminis TaxID=2836180 RepID=UPI001BDB0731|nr:ATP-dependent 6-phosphofructokinase [Alteromonas oceanisediminis]MBT0587189.1 ATP-dependent 6-phosphofructokinase [Alteromonas oceanisediminis]
MSKKSDKRVAVLTSGGDAPGMNACIRAIVIACEYYHYECVGYRHGYHGLLQQNHKVLHNADVHNLIQRGGTVLQSARCVEFKSAESGRLAAQNLDQLGVDALIIIGGDGSFRGAEHLSHYWQGQVIGIPGTIDNDISGTDATIGCYTAIETAVSSIDKVRDTADAFERIFLVEVMGRHSGFIALNAALASASDHVIVPELFVSEQASLDTMFAEINHRRDAHGSVSYIVVVAENVWPGGLPALTSALEARTSIDVRPVTLGHVQRGGSPVPQDRLLASKLGAHAIKAIKEGVSGVMIGEVNHQPVEVPLQALGEQHKPLQVFSVDTMHVLVNATNPSQP